MRLRLWRRRDISARRGEPRDAMLKKKGPAPVGDWQRGGDGAALAGSASLIAQTKHRGPARWREAAERRFPNARILPLRDGGGPFAVVSHCWASPRISLHKTLPRAKKVMNDLWEAGCGWWIPGTRA